MVKEVRELLQKLGVLKDKFVVAVSGGVDSMVLLYVMKEIGVDMVAAHLDHGIRETSVRDARFVEKECEKLGIKLFLERRVVKKRKGETLEEAARRVRYGFLREIKERVEAKYIALAHHATDLAETILHRIIRGSGLRGLIGMKVLDGDLLRPLLYFTRKEIEEFAAERGIEYVVDETNFDVKYTRNFIRHRVLSLLRELNPSVERSFLRLSRNVQQAWDFISSVVNEKLKSARKLALGIDFEVPENRYIESEMIRAAFESLYGIIPDREKVEKAVELREGRYYFHEDKGIWKSLGRIFVGRIEREEICHPLAVGVYDFWDFKVEVKEGRGIRYVEGMVLRNRRVGDKIGGIKLKDYLVERRVPAYLRDEVPLVALGKNVVWVMGRIVDPRFKGNDLALEVLGGDLV